MKKLAIGVLSAGALAVAGCLATSYYMGGRIQQTLEATAHTWSAEEGLTVRFLEYQRGITQSQATTLWSLTTPDDTYDITVTHDIVHGPWPFGKAARVVTRFLLPEDSEPQLVQALQHQAPLEWTTTASWSGKTVHSLRSPDFSTRFEDGSSLTWGGLHSEWSLSAQRTAAQGFVRMPLLQIQVEDGSGMDLEDVAITFDVHMPAPFNFWLGPSDMRVGLIALHNAETATHVKLQQLAIHSTSTLQDQRVQMALQTQVAKLHMPGYQLDNLALDMHFQHVDAQWLDTFMAWMQRNPQDDEEQGNALLHSLPALLAGQPEFAITRLGADTPDGPAQLSARVTYAGQQPEAFNPLIDLQAHVRATVPQAVVRQLLEGKVRSDYLELLEQLGQELDDAALQAAVDDGVRKRLQALLELGVMHREGTAFSAEVELEQGEIKLNGQPQELQNLLQMGGAI